MFKYFTDNEFKILLSFESPFDLFSLVLQMSDEITLMFGFPSYEHYINPIKYAEEDNMHYAKEKSIPNRIHPDINYADHGFFNLTLTKVRFIYSFSKILFELKDTTFKNLIHSNYYAVRSMYKALDTFTAWKNLYRKKEIELRGENWGSATGWTKWIPNEYSK